MKNRYIIIVLMVASMQLFAQDTKMFFEKANNFFQANVDNGKLAYERINSNSANLDELIRLSKSLKVSLENKNEYKAFWVNVYNLYVIHGIIENYPTNSPLSINGFFDKKRYEVGGEKVTLNDIENKLLRAVFKDARLHFVLVCGAESCPPIINKAYLPATINEQLEQQTKLAINGDYFIKVNMKKKRVECSEIMKWYKEDFTMNGTSEIDFINKYKTEKLSGKYKITYSTYNWKLNKQ